MESLGRFSRQSGNLSQYEVPINRRLLHRLFFQEFIKVVFIIRSADIHHECYEFSFDTMTGVPKDTSTLMIFLALSLILMKTSVKWDTFLCYADVDNIWLVAIQIKLNGGVMMVEWVFQI